MLKYIIVVLVCIYAHSEAKQVPLKVVYEPSLFGLDQSGDNLISPSEDGNKLTLAMQPANVSGPSQFKRLVGRCYVFNTDKYKYSVCPYHNITQHDKTNMYNPFEGVLGVWQGWEIENNKFSSMVMGHGDRCGDIRRETKVIFTCGKTSRVLNITEPSHCNYLVNFTTPLVCDPTSMLVYPRLTKEQKQRWDQLETDLTIGDITEKGYRKGLKKVFEDAGLQLSGKKVEELENMAYKQKAGKSPQFANVYQCQDHYSDLRAELEKVKSELRACQQGEAEKDYQADEEADMWKAAYTNK